MKRYPITYLMSVSRGTDKPEFKHAVVVSETDDVIQFVYRYSPETTPTFVLNKSDEGALWVRGFLHWWWPPHRQMKKAMLAAAAMGHGGLRVHETAQAKINASYDQMMKKFQGDMRRLQEDALKLFTPMLPGTQIRTFKRTIKRTSLVDIVINMKR